MNKSFVYFVSLCYVVGMITIIIGGCLLLTNIGSNFN